LHAQPMESTKTPRLLIILGASGTGKTTILKNLLGRLEGFILIDADVFWRNEFNAPETGFIEFKKYCLRIASHISQNGCTVVYFLQGTPEEFEGVSERSLFSEVHHMFLVCSRDDLVDRLRSKPEGWGLLDQNQSHLEELLAYNEKLKQVGRATGTPVTDTSALCIERATEKVLKWISAVIEAEDE
jgi:2-phosphoglycerate kinase